MGVKRMLEEQRETSPQATRIFTVSKKAKATLIISRNYQ